MGTVLVTGGTGYIGSHTCVELLNSGYNVVVLDNLTNSNEAVIDKIESISKKRLRFYNGDIRDKTLLEKIFSENKISAVLHFAGLKSVADSCKRPLDYYDNNVYGTLVLCQVMNKFNVKKLVFSSSATVYGKAAISPCYEDMPIGNTTNPYGTTKFMIECILQDLYKSDNTWSIVVLRYFNPTGAHKSAVLSENPNGVPNNIMPVILRVAKGEQEKLTIFGNNYDTPDGTCVRDYIHVVDLARGHIKSMQKLNNAGVNVYNLGTGHGYSVLELISAFEKVSSCKIAYEIGKKRSGDLPIVYANTDKAYKELGFKAAFGIYDMCKDAFLAAKI